MNQQFTQNIINQKVETDKIVSQTKINIIESKTNSTQDITKGNIITYDSPGSKKIKLYRVQKNSENKSNIISNEKYKIIIRNIAKKLKKRVRLPKCKFFKFYMPYRTLIIRIANRLKKTAKKLNFWEKWENNNITEQEIDKIQEIASTACKIIQQGAKKKTIKRKGFSSSDKKNNLKIKLSLFKKSNEMEEKSKFKNNTNNRKSEVHKEIIYLKSLNTDDNMINFINEFSSFLKDNNIEIIQDSKLPLFTNQDVKYLLSRKEFWIKYIIYISQKYKNDLTIYNYINFIEQFYIWNNNDIFTDDFNNEIKTQINLIFTQEVIKNFLLFNKINNIDELFERYKYIHINNNYREAKISNVECQCPACINNGFISKIIYYNKKHNIISYSENNNLSFVANINNKNKNNNPMYKYYDQDIFEYLNKIEKGKKYEDEEVKEKEKEKRNKNSSNKKRKKSINKKNRKRNKSNKNDKIQEIFDILSIDGDFQSSDDNKKEDSYPKKPQRRKSKKNGRK